MFRSRHVLIALLVTSLTAVPVVFVGAAIPAGKEAPTSRNFLAHIQHWRSEKF